MVSLFNLKAPREPKPLSRHPWANIIKDIFSHRIKYAHNSARNPLYPKTKERIPDSDRITLTVTGDRVTKEFIYCVNLVKGLHKYRWKKFGVPSIRGVNSVEWPDVWRSLKIEHGGLAHCLKSKVAVLVDDKFLGGEDELKELVESKYIYHLILDYCSEAVAGFASYIRCSGRSCAYMHIAINEKHIGTLIFMLYSDIVPYTCENFLRLCKETRGGYSGTPIHRIVKDGWIQAGGFCLKNTDLDCENFNVPHDRRGVLGMANDGRNVDCSTQFFVLLQPAPWMAHKFVAFGQLIEGDETLKKIEAVPTWYESPISSIVIYKAGIFNMECHDIMINRGANEYIHGHIEDLNVLGKLLIEILIERVYLEIELKNVERLQKELFGEGEEEHDEESGNMRETKRFIRRKEDIEKQMQSAKSISSQMSKVKSQRSHSAKSKRSRSAKSRRSRSPKSQSTPIVKSRTSTRSQFMQSQITRSQLISDDENNEFDVEEYEPEETSYQHLSLAASTLTSISLPERPYYIALTDVPYPGEIDSTYDLKKFLKGHYCLESDLDPVLVNNAIAKKQKLSYPSEMFEFQRQIESESESSSQSLESDDEKEIRQYLKNNADRVSFGGGLIKLIARGTAKTDLFESVKKSQLMTDEELRRLRLASVDYRNRDKDKKVRIAPSATESAAPRPQRRPTGFVRPSDISGSDVDMTRQSVLQRLFDDVTNDDDTGPTLKDYRPFGESHQKSILLTFSPTSRIKSDEDTHRFLRHSIQIDRNEASFEQVLDLQHSKKIARKISSDYVKTIDQIEHKAEASLRSIEFAKTRPSMSVAEYQQRNHQHLSEIRSSKFLVKSSTSHPGIR